MPVKLYESLVLLDASKVSGDLAGAAATLHATLEKYHAHVEVSRLWKEQKLAYPINGQKKGIYYLIVFRADAQVLVDIETDYRLNELVLRQMTLRVDPKWEEKEMEMARDDHALAIQTMVDDPVDAAISGRAPRPEPVAAGA